MFVGGRWEGEKKEGGVGGREVGEERGIRIVIRFWII